jgi:PIN domain nuclease of toxin-antitoxin system
VNLLIDTHVLLWWLDDSPRLGRAGRTAIADNQNFIAVSAATAWEIAIKQAAGRLEAPADLLGAIDAEGFDPLPITFPHAREAGALPRHHADPFDRMLIAQARLEALTLVTADPNIAHYDVAVLRP